MEKFLQSGILVLGAILLISCATKTTEVAEEMGEKAAIQYQFAYDSYITNDLIPALGAAMRAREISPNNPEIHNLLGLIYFRQDKFAESEESFKKAATLDPKMSEVYNNLGTLYYAQQKYADAEKAFTKALENPLYLYPERIHNNLGLVYMAQKRGDEAKQQFEQSIKFRRDFYLPYQNLAKLHIDRDERRQAEGLLGEVIKLCQDCSEARYHLGKLLMKDNKPAEALKLFKRGAEIDPDGYYGQLCKQYIAQ